jgi:hypothetical protein
MLNTVCNLFVEIPFLFQRKNGSLSLNYRNLHYMLMKERFRDQNLITWSVHSPVPFLVAACSIFV